jgi:surface protein
MFNKCYKLKKIKGINNFNTSKVNSFMRMFKNCEELEYLDLSNFDVSSAQEMRSMFNECHKLKEIKGINNFNTINAYNMDSMFFGCEELTYLDLSNFDISKVKNLNFMFALCYKLKEIKGINNFHFSNDANFIGIFGECKELDLYKLNTSDEIKINYKKLLAEINSKNIDLIKLFDVKKEINICFTSVAQDIQYFISCYTTDAFINIEEKLLKNFPELNNKEFYYICFGGTLSHKNKLKTLIQNGIKNDVNIIINYLDKKLTQYEIDESEIDLLVYLENAEDFNIEELHNARSLYPFFLQ